MPLGIENIEPISYYNEANELIRGSINVIEVSMTKGLEFEKVIVIAQGLNRNEYYVACTRAINELYVYKGECLRTKNAYGNQDEQSTPTDIITAGNGSSEETPIASGNKESHDMGSPLLSGNNELESEKKLEEARRQLELLETEYQSVKYSLFGEKARRRRELLKEIWKIQDILNT